MVKDDMGLVCWVKLNFLIRQDLICVWYADNGKV